MARETTYELELRFPAPATKRAVLADLEVRGITEYAEGVIDGVADALPDGAAFGDDDASPVLIYGTEAQLSALGAALAARHSVEWRVVELVAESWQEAWATEFESLVTDRFVVHPVGWPGPVPPGRIAIPIHPGEAFGSGRHATTAAALAALESLPSDHPSDGFLDVGTGNGVLAIAAAKLAFTRLVATEIDADALVEARANAALSHVTLDLLLSPTPPDDDRRYSVIAANILVPVLHALLPLLTRLLRPDGSLILAGFVEKEEAPLVAAAQRLGLTVASRLTRRGWLGLIFRRWL